MIGITRTRELHFNLGNYESITLSAKIEYECPVDTDEIYKVIDESLTRALEGDIKRARLITSLDKTQSSIHEEIWK